MVSITQVPVQGQNNGMLKLTADNYTPGSAVVATGPGSGTGGVPTFSGSGSTQTTYVFDAVLELEHEQRLEKTHHPVQTGADISSHAYLMPARLVMFVGMSDAMDAYSNGQNNANSADNASPSTVTPFTGASSSKSVNAYQTMIALQAARQPLTVTTRLRTYTNMMVVGVSPHEDHKTITGLRMRVEFEQIFLASTMAGATMASQPAVSARPDTAVASGLGQVSTSAVPKVTQQQFQVPQMAPATAYSLPANDLGTDYLVNVPGAGNYSSVAGQQGKP
jgi:hypothetical protein